jgi:HEAT repeat protein
MARCGMFRALKRKVLIGLGVIGVVIALFVALAQRTRPTASYQGIPVSDWALILCQNSDPQSTNAVSAFQAMGSNAVPPLQKMLRTKETWYARWYLQQSNILPRRMRSYLAGKIKPGQSASKRLAAARALGIVGTNATAAVPDLVIALADTETRWVAAQALADIGGPAIAGLTMATTNKDANVRHAAVYGLGQAGTDAATTTAVLLDRVLDPYYPVQASAVYSITQMGRPGLVTVLEAYSSESAERRQAAVKALKAMNTPTRQIVGSLLEFTTNSSPRLRQSSLEVLNGLQVNHPRVVANYFKAAADSDVGVRLTAARTLAQANNWSTNATFGVLVAHLLDRRITSLQSNAVETLTGLLSDSELPVREAARQSLASLQASIPN